MRSLAPIGLMLACALVACSTPTGQTSTPPASPPPQLDLAEIEAAILATGDVDDVALTFEDDSVGGTVTIADDASPAAVADALGTVLAAATVLPEGVSLHVDVESPIAEHLVLGDRTGVRATELPGLVDDVIAIVAQHAGAEVSIGVLADTPLLVTDDLGDAASTAAGLDDAIAFAAHVADFEPASSTNLSWHVGGETSSLYASGPVVEEVLALAEAAAAAVEAGTIVAIDVRSVPAGQGTVSHVDLLALAEEGEDRETLAARLESSLAELFESATTAGVAMSVWVTEWDVGGPLLHVGD